MRNEFTAAIQTNWQFFDDVNKNQSVAFMIRDLQTYHAYTFTGQIQLSGGVLDSRPRGRGFEPHWCHCVVSLGKTHLSLLSTDSTQEDPSPRN